MVHTKDNSQGKDRKRLPEALSHENLHLASSRREQVVGWPHFWRQRCLQQTLNILDSIVWAAGNLADTREFMLISEHRPKQRGFADEEREARTAEGQVVAAPRVNPGPDPVI